MNRLWPLLIPLLSASLSAKILRNVSSSSCNSVAVNVGLDMTTQLVFEQEPKVTLFADKRHFKIVTNALSPRSLAIIPFIEGNELDVFRNSSGHLPSGPALASALDKNFNTNLFVFFDHGNQLTFHLHFVDKSKADNIVKIQQKFDDGCVL